MITSLARCQRPHQRDGISAEFSFLVSDNEIERIIRGFFEKNGYRYRSGMKLTVAHLASEAGFSSQNCGGSHFHMRACRITRQVCRELELQIFGTNRKSSENVKTQVLGYSDADVQRYASNLAALRAESQGFAPPRNLFDPRSIRYQILNELLRGLPQLDLAWTPVLASAVAKFAGFGTLKAHSESFQTATAYAYAFAQAIGLEMVPFGKLTVKMEVASDPVKAEGTFQELKLSPQMQEARSIVLQRIKHLIEVADYNRLCARDPDEEKFWCLEAQHLRARLTPDESALVPLPRKLLDAQCLTRALEVLNRHEGSCARFSSQMRGPRPHTIGDLMPRTHTWRCISLEELIERE
jgi:hypothetical protein